VADPTIEVDDGSFGIPCPFLLLLLLVRTRRNRRRRFRLVKASKTFCLLGANTATRKKSQGHPRKAKRCALPCSQMAKVEPNGILRSWRRKLH
jgi:hypothetical protein